MIAPQELAEKALAAARANETIVIVTDGSEAALRWAGNSMTTNAATTSRTWTVVSIVHDGDTTRVGSVTSASTDPADITGVVRAAENAARDATPATDAIPLAPVRVSSDWSDEPGRTDVGVFTAFADGLAAGFDGADRLYGFAHHQVHTTTLATSTGLRLRHEQPTGSVELNGKRDSDSATASAWAGVNTADFTDVDTQGLLSEVSRRLDWAARRVELPAGRYETLLPPSTVADLMISLAWAMEGRGAHEGRTAFAAPGGTRVGERLTSMPLTLYSDPSATGLGYCPFVVAGSSSETTSVFDNGVPTGRTDWIRDGVVNQLVYPRAAAHELSAPFAAVGDNLLLSGGSNASVDDMVATTERGLLLTTLWYIREVDPTTMLLTGLTRDGVYLVQDGAIAGAVNNFRFNESPLDLLRRVSEAGRAERTLPREWNDYFTRAHMPTLRVPDFHMSSVSPAT